MSAQSSTSPFEAADGKVFTYQANVRAGHVTHMWTLADDTGGNHIHASLSEFRGSKEWMGGIETHYRSPPDYMSADKPSHDHCWVLGGPCWHDGSSLYFSENIAQMLPNPWNDHPNHMADRHHAAMLMELRYFHRLRFSVEEQAA